MNRKKKLYKILEKKPLHKFYSANDVFFLSWKMKEQVAKHAKVAPPKLDT